MRWEGEVVEKRGEGKTTASGHDVEEPSRTAKGGSEGPEGSGEGAPQPGVQSAL